MSFQFQRPIGQSINTSSDSGTFDNEHHYKLMRHSGPDYDKLIVPLSLYAFARLSPDDQLEHLIEICSGQNVNAEEMEFRELFKKLKYLDQLRFLSQVLNLFKCEKFIPSFKQLDADHQQQVIDQMAYVTREILRSPEETEEDFRLRKFIQRYKSGHTWNVEKLLAPKKHGDDQQEEEKEHISDWKSRFSELFLGFSLIWFLGQWASGQDMLIEQLSKGVSGGLVKIEKDSEIATFSELCKKVVDFRVQERFLDNALEKLEGWRYDKKILEPQDYDGAAELLSDLSTLGFGQLSAEYQHHKIEELSNKVGNLNIGHGLYLTEVSTSKKQERYDLSEEAIRIRRFRELLDQVSVPTRIDVFRELRKVMSKHRYYSEAVHFFSGLGSEDQTEIIEKLVQEVGDSSEPVIEKTYGESEEDLRSRRFKNVCTRHLSSWNYIAWSRADKERVRRCTSDHNEEESPYAEFLLDVSVTWFKARCTNYHRNPIQVLFSGEVEVTEKFPEESEEGFRLRRFAEWFKKLEFTSRESIFNYIFQKKKSIFNYIQTTLFDASVTWFKARCTNYHRNPIITDYHGFRFRRFAESFKKLGFTSKESILDYIQRTLFDDLGYPEVLEFANSYTPPAVGRDLFDSEWIKMKLPNLQGQGAAATTAQVVSASATTTQAGGTVFRFLCEHEIIEKYIATDEDVANFFRNMGKDVPFDIGQGYLVESFKEVNEYQRNRRHVRWAGFRFKYFDSPWTFLSALAAVILLILTATQTIFAVYAYVLPA